MGGRRWYPVLVVCIGLGAVLTGALLLVNRPHTTVSVKTPAAVSSRHPHDTTRPASSTATNASFKTTVVLHQTLVRGGTTIHGTVVVINHTHTKITEPLACRDATVAVALSNSGHQSAWAWSAVGCRQAFGFPPGRTVLPIVVTTDYDDTSGGLVPLPPGRYQARLHVNRFRLPIPAPIPVTISQG